MSNPQLVGLWAYDPKEAAKWVREAIEREKEVSSNYIVDRAALRLKVSRRTLFRWLREKVDLSGIADELTRLSAESDRKAGAQ